MSIDFSQISYEELLPGTMETEDEDSIMSILKKSVYK